MAPKPSAPAVVIPEVVEKPKDVLEPPAGQYALTFEGQVEKSLLKLRAKNVRRFNKVWKSLGFLAEHGPEHPPLRTAKMTNTNNGYCSFAENGTPGAWRLWWMWGEGSSQIRVTEVGPTP